MPSFDVVSKTDLQEVDNALQSVSREISTRYDFKGSNCEISRKEDIITITADDNYKLEAIQDMLKVHITRRNLDTKALEFKDAKKAAGNTLKQEVTVKQGIETEVAKKIVKALKDDKLKVQASIRADELRIEGKKRDDLQEAIAFIKKMDVKLPLQYINFRD